ncbi:MAG: hypothetical protein ACXVG9_03200 [Terriglobales bacterium]
MTPVFLIAANFVRENRWPLISLLVYVLVFGGAAIILGGSTLEDAVFFLRSAGVYGLAFTGLLAVSGVNNERRTRRMLAVLSKGIERWQYLGGLLLGVMVDAAIYSVAIFAVGTLAFARYGQSSTVLWELAGLLLASFLLAATVALFYSTLLHPLMATAAAAITLATMGALGRVLGGMWANVLPSYTLAEAMVNFSGSGWHAPWAACGWAVAESVVFAAMAALAFSRRDIAVAIE